MEVDSWFTSALGSGGRVGVDNEAVDERGDEVSGDIVDELGGVG